VADWFESVDFAIQVARFLQIIPVATHNRSPAIAQKMPTVPTRLAYSRLISSSHEVIFLPSAFDMIKNGGPLVSISV
jgi:hypothetical protein